MITVKDIAKYILFVYALQTDCIYNTCYECNKNDLCAIYEVTIDKLLKEGVY